MISKDKQSFSKYVAFYYSNEIFGGPSVYFHSKVIDFIRNNDYASLLKNERFMECIYATLASWGMHRMGSGGSKMKNFDEFKDSIQMNEILLMRLRDYRLDTLPEENKMRATELLKELFNKLRVMQSNSNLVGNSKVIHHLLPDLVPPIDREYTLRFFYGSLTSKYSPQFSKNEETDIFINIVNYFWTIRKKVSLTENDYDKTKSFNTSIPKVIDNAIIGFIQSVTSPD